jgi:Sel1 repeat
MRCPRCGNENPSQNRFCGMCGSTLLAAPEAPATQPQRVVTATSAAPAKEAPVTRAQVSEPPRPVSVPDDSPSISGPSFLGLNDPPSRKRGNLSVDSGDGRSRNLDYLLEEEDHHKSSGAAKFFLILVALALAGGLGYLRWKHQGFGSLIHTQKPTATSEPSSDANSSSPTPSSQPPAAAQPATQPAPGSTPPASNAATPLASGNASPAATPATSAPVDTAKPTDNAASAPITTDKPPEASSTAVAPKQPPAPSSDAMDEAKPAPAHPAPKPAATKPVAPTDPVAEAQKYLYGRGGVSQDCDRGMRYLKPAANQGNAKAMIEMGALYSAGLCTPHDLPTAYRWFAIALRKDPGNQDVQADLQKLWGEMTQPERQLAIKLTQ